MDAMREEDLLKQFGVTSRDLTMTRPRPRPRQLTTGLSVPSTAGSI